LNLLSDSSTNTSFLAFQPVVQTERRLVEAHLEEEEGDTIKKSISININLILM
jgi:hypothetical protein